MGRTGKVQEKPQCSYPVTRPRFELASNKTRIIYSVTYINNIKYCHV
jgi:hypothetical protein